MFRFRVGFDERTINRYTQQIYESGSRRTRAGAEQAGELMAAEARKIAEEKGSGQRAREVQGDMLPDRRRAAKDLYGYRVIQTAEGHRAIITAVQGATPQEIEKLRAIEKGSRPHKIVAKKKAMTGWNWEGKRQFAKSVDHRGTPALSIGRLARDRVYQRIRRRTV